MYTIYSKFSACPTQLYSHAHNAVKKKKKKEKLLAFAEKNRRVNGISASMEATFFSRACAPITIELKRTRSGIPSDARALFSGDTRCVFYAKSIFIFRSKGEKSFKPRRFIIFFFCSARKRDKSETFNSCHGNTYNGTI